MLTTEQKKTAQVFLGILVAGIIVHSVLGFYALLSSEPRFRLRPRHVGEVQVRGRTYHTHKTQPTDIKHQALYLKRRQLTFRPHLAARRNILAHNIHKRSLNYHRVSAEEDGIDLTCQTCSVIGYSAHLIRAGYGHDIDKSDCIFRMGLSPVKGFERDVGSRTTLRVLDQKSFDLLMKRPAKLVTGTQSSPKWVIFDNKNIDTAIKIQLKLPEIKRQYPNITIYILSTIGENAVYSSFMQNGKRLGYKMLNAQPATLWQTVQTVSAAGCSQTKFYGILDSKYCKLSNSDASVRLNYWDIHSPPSCSDGADSCLHIKSGDHAVSLNDRRALLSWSQNRTVTFEAPRWPQI